MPTRLVTRVRTYAKGDCMNAARIKELPLGEILTQELVLDGMTSRTKKAAIEELVGLLYKEGWIKKKSEAVTRVLEREDLVTTALGEGVAISRMRGLKLVKNL